MPIDVETTSKKITIEELEEIFDEDIACDVHPLIGCRCLEQTLYNGCCGKPAAKRVLAHCAHDARMVFLCIDHFLGLHKGKIARKACGCTWQP